MVFEKLRAIIADQLGVNEDDITLDKNYKTDLDADSLSLFQIINDAEDEFDIKIDETDGIETVGDTVSLVESLIEQRPE